MPKQTDLRDGTTRPYSHVAALLKKFYRNRQHIFPALVFYKHHFLH